MAKISKKGSPLATTSDSANLLQFLVDDMDEMLTLPNAETVNHIPPADMFSTSDSFIIELEMPGVRQEDIELTIFNNVLTVRGVKYECFRDPKVNYVCMERIFGKLFRNIKLPCPVNPSQIKAVFKSGLLTLQLPKVVEKRGEKKRIPIESSS
jgi:HSP20 family protein